MRRLRVQLTVLLACSLCWCWRGAGRVLGARDAARTSASAQAGVDRVDELRRAATRLSRDLVAMETSRRAYLVTGDEAVRRAHLRAGARAGRGVRRVRRLSRPWVELSPLADRVARQYQAWVRTGRAELAAHPQGARAAAAVAASASYGAADRRFRALWSGQGVENELGAVASDLETMRRRLAGRMEALERLRHLSAQVVGATSLQRPAEVALDGLRPEVGATRAILGAARPAGDLVLRALAWAGWT